MSIDMFYGLLCAIMLSVLQGCYVEPSPVYDADMPITITTMDIGAGENDKDASHSNGFSVRSIYHSL